MNLVFYKQKQTNSSQKFSFFLLRTILQILRTQKLCPSSADIPYILIQPGCIYEGFLFVSKNSSQQFDEFLPFFSVQFCKFCVRKSIVQLISLILVYRSVARLALAFTTVHTSSHDPLRFQSSHQVSYVTFFLISKVHILWEGHKLLRNLHFILTGAI